MDCNAAATNVLEKVRDLGCDIMVFDVAMILTGPRLRLHQLHLTVILSDITSTTAQLKPLILFKTLTIALIVSRLLSLLTRKICCRYVEIGFESGIPVSVNGKRLSPGNLVAELNQIGGRHGIGRVDLVEDRIVGMKSRGVYETPGGTILFTAARDLETLTLDRETLQLKDSLALKYAELVYAGRWFDPLRESMDAFVENISKTTTGSVSLKLYKGSASVTGRKSPYSLYREDISSFESGEIYNHADAVGFIRLYGLPLRIRAMMEQGI
jgi:argininosuccinate synthase